MHAFISDIVTARGFSIRNLAKSTGNNYAGVREFLLGMPNRLSDERIGWIFDFLDLDEHGRLKPNTLYNWNIEIKDKNLAALNRILRTVSHNGYESGLNLSHSLNAGFKAVPLLGDTIKGLPAPYWILRRNDIHILVKWQLPNIRNPVTQLPGFYDGSKKHFPPRPLINPDISELNALAWAPGMELSPSNISGVQLTHEQLTRLNRCVTERVNLEAIKEWLPKEFMNDAPTASKKEEQFISNIPPHIALIGEYNQDCNTLLDEINHLRKTIGTIQEIVNYRCGDFNLDDFCREALNPPQQEDDSLSPT